MMSNIFNSFESKEELVKKLSFEISNRLQESIALNNKASLLVSGGNTPKLLFKNLSKMEIPWEKVTIALVDERWIEVENKDSNELLVKSYLMQNFASKAKFISMFIPNIKACDAQELCNKNYETITPFDVIVLGMGTDAHTASLFPNNEKLEKAYDLENKSKVISIKPKTAPYERMSLTLKSILSAKSIFLHIEGEEKLKVYKKALIEENRYEMPISSVLNQKEKKIEVYYS